MKRTLIIVLAAISIVLSNCGPSAEELKRQKEIEDSLINIDRETSLDKASQLLESIDSLQDTSSTALQK